MAGRRNNWGTVVPRFKVGSKKKEQRGWTARYKSPVIGDHSTVSRNFPLDSKGQAYAWLDAEQKLVRLYKDGRGDWTRPSEREKKTAEDNITFRDYAAQWLEAHRTPKGEMLKGSSKRKIKVDIGHLNDSFGDMRMVDITVSDVDNWLDDCPLDGEYARYHAYKTMRSIMGKAATKQVNQKQPLIPYSPCQRPATEPASEQAKIEPATPEELYAIYLAMPAYMRISVYLSVGAGGLRISEVCALQRRDVDFRNRILHVRHSINRGSEDRGNVQIDTPKTSNSIRDIPLPDRLIPMLRKHMGQYTGKTPDSMLIPNIHGGILTRQLLYKRFKEAAVKAGRPELHFHTLRSTATTNIVLNGGTLAEVMAYAGHSDSRTAVEKYQHVLNQHERDVVNATGNILIPEERTAKVIQDEMADCMMQIGELQNRIKTLQEELEATRI